MAAAMPVQEKQNTIDTVAFLGGFARVVSSAITNDEWAAIIAEAAKDIVLHEKFRYLRTIPDILEYLHTNRNLRVDRKKITQGVKEEKTPLAPGARFVCLSDTGEQFPTPPPTKRSSPDENEKFAPIKKWYLLLSEKCELRVLSVQWQPKGHVFDEGSAGVTEYWFSARTMHLGTENVKCYLDIADGYREKRLRVDTYPVHILKMFRDISGEVATILHDQARYADLSFARHAQRLNSIQRS